MMKMIEITTICFIYLIFHKIQSLKKQRRSLQKKDLTGSDWKLGFCKPGSKRNFSYYTFRLTKASATLIKDKKEPGTHNRHIPHEISLWDVLALQNVLNIFTTS